MRLDIYLTENSLCKSRTAAQSLIKSGGVSLNGIPCTKPSQEVGEGDTVDIIGEQLRYVGRGGLKLEAALDKFALDITRRGVHRHRFLNGRLHGLHVTAWRGEGLGGGRRQRSA